jgi:hypothetical protein
VLADSHAQSERAARIQCRGIELRPNNSVSHHQISRPPSPNHVTIPHVPIIPFLTAFAQTHRSTGSIIQIPFAQFSIRISHADMTAQWPGKASPAMNEVFRTTTKDKHVSPKALASIRVNSESVSNEINGSDRQYEKHDEQKI